jgi:KDO2-lipid IV(A) lauroyltransferase
LTFTFFLPKFWSSSFLPLFITLISIGDMRIQHRLEFLAVQATAWIARLLPLRLAIGLGRVLGWFAFEALLIRRSVTLENLRCAYPQQPRWWIRKTAGSCYRHFGRVVVELARLPIMNAQWVEKFVEIRGRDVLDRCLKQGKGGIVLSGHLGNWEIMGASAAVLGYPITYIVTTQRNKGVEAWMDNLRKAKGIEIIKTHDSPKRMIQALKNNRLMAVLSDQDAHEDGEFVPFFGRPASTPRGGPVLHLKTGASLLFGYAVGLPKGKWQIIYEDIPLQSNQEDIKEAVTQLLTYATGRLEQEIRNHPEQWLWMHRRWKTQPQQ